ncbi:MAG: hypothetical protein ACLQVL_26365 [Terriglobia bacterium]
MAGCCWRRAVLTGMLGLGTSFGWAQTKVMTVSLKPYGWMSQEELSVQHPDPDREGYTISGPPGGMAWRGVGEVVVDGQGRVYVGLPIWASGAAPKSAARGVGDKLRVLVLKAGVKGQVERTMDFPTRSLDRLDMRLALDGTLLLVADDKLMRVGADGRPTAELPLPNAEKEYEPWYLESSTTGRTVRVRFNYKTSLLVDAQTLAVLKRCQEPDDLNDIGGMTDDLELSSQVETTQPGLTYGLEREVFCEKRERLRQFGDIAFSPSVVDDERFLAIGREMIALRKLNGETLWTSRAPAERMLDEDRLSRDGSRVAVRLLRSVLYHEPVNWPENGSLAKTFEQVQFTRPRTRTVEIEDSIAVWEVATGRLVGHAPVQREPGDGYFNQNSSFALSPDGRLLAVLQDGLLILWKI